MERWSLVCDNDVYFKSISQSLFFVGHLVGALTAGLLADWFGRKRAFMIILIPTIGSCLASYFVDDPYGWMVIRCLFYNSFLKS
jgi:MFS family permease